MSALKELKATFLQERKARRSDHARICSTILGELETVSKRDGVQPTDENVYGKIQKTIRNNQDNMSLITDPKKIQALSAENAFLQTLLPLVMDEPALRQAIEGLGIKDVGQVMRRLSAEYAGRFDRAMAARIAKTL